MENSLGWERWESGVIFIYPPLEEMISSTLFTIQLNTINISTCFTVWRTEKMGCNYVNCIFLKALHLLINLTIKMCTLKVQSSKLSNAGDISIHHSSGFFKTYF